MPFLLDSLFSSIAYGHFIVDLLNGIRPVYLAYLSGPLGLTNTTLGVISTLYVWTASLTQPVFGLAVQTVSGHAGLLRVAYSG